jgi:hypothetical protein
MMIRGTRGSKWKHWCPKGCGKSVVCLRSYSYKQRYKYHCIRCDNFFNKEELE